ncbi:hypothetical protein KUCAC02_010306 [Chaenocephalus aceratus]|uniref:Uncharacterized protein n=1 Tax=Chaenocephalus aceratus TaxID=36190 RepID=A0ACB9VZ29_CHAAC|nr:hypothetical protein KUCAC02_010306 [Chaenocephalus aceratus]
MFIRDITDTSKGKDKPQRCKRLCDWQKRKAWEIDSGDKVKSALPKPAEAFLHSLRPGDWVLIKDIRWNHWKQRRFAGPFQVLLTTPATALILEPYDNVTCVHTSKLGHAKRGQLSKSPHLKCTPNTALK